MSWFLSLPDWAISPLLVHNLDIFNVLRWSCARGESTSVQSGSLIGAGLSPCWQEQLGWTLEWAGCVPFVIYGGALGCQRRGLFLTLVTTKTHPLCQ